MSSSSSVQPGVLSAVQRLDANIATLRRVLVDANARLESLELAQLTLQRQQVALLQQVLAGQRPA